MPNTTSILGFEGDELRSLLAQQEAAGRLTDEDEIPEPPAELVSQPDDLWMRGNHRLIRGDCINPEVLSAFSETRNP